MVTMVAAGGKRPSIALYSGSFSCARSKKKLPGRSVGFRRKRYTESAVFRAYTKGASSGTIIALHHGFGIEKAGTAFAQRMARASLNRR